jgi:hypothetical protein
MYEAMIHPVKIISVSINKIQIHCYFRVMRLGISTNKIEINTHIYLKTLFYVKYIFYVL